MLPMSPFERHLYIPCRMASIWGFVAARAFVGPSVTFHGCSHLNATGSYSKARSGAHLISPHSNELRTAPRNLLRGVARALSALQGALIYSNDRTGNERIAAQYFARASRSLPPMLPAILAILTAPAVTSEKLQGVFALPDFLEL
jgi:hypothetical protein